MSLLVQKFGGTSVGTTERIQSVAEKVSNYRPTLVNTMY